MQTERNAIASEAPFVPTSPTARPSSPHATGLLLLARHEVKRSRCTEAGPPSGCEAVGFGLARPVTLSQISLDFAVSPDEEHVTIDARCGPTRISLGSRSHHYLLLTLARKRTKDRAAGLPETSCGWIDAEHLHLDADAAIGRVNVDVFRIRRQFEASGVIDGHHIVERRWRSHKLRIGIDRFAIRRV